MNPRILKLTQMDDDIYKKFEEHFPNLKIDQLNEEELKSPAGKEVDY